MTWMKIDDGIFDHPKILRAGGDATLLYLAGIAYASRNLTDGFIPLVKLATLTDRAKPEKLANHLIKIGLWELAEDGFAVKDYLQYQRAKSTVVQQRETAKKRVSSHRAKSTSNADVTALQERYTTVTDTEPFDVTTTLHTRDSNADVTSVRGRGRDRERVREKQQQHASVETSDAISLPPAAAAAVDLILRIREHQTQDVVNPAAWRKKVRAGILTDYSDDLRAAVDANPSATPVELVKACTPFTDWDLADVTEVSA